MNILTNALISAGIAGALFFSGFMLSQQLQPAAPAQKLGGTFTPAQIPQTYLSGGGVTSSQSTIPLTSFLTRDGRSVTMSMFGSIGYGTLEPGTSKEEIVSFTGVTQNSNGSATLTGVLRGLDFISPYAASSTLQKSHGGNATFIISNTAPFYGQQFVFTNNNGTSTAILTFSSTTPPRYDNVGVQSNGSAIATTSEFASVAYVNAVSFAGTSNASAVAKGIVQIATALQAASSTNTGSSGAIDVLWGKYATDTPQNCSTPANGGCVIMSLLNGKLNQSWLDFSQTWAFNSAASTTFANGLYANQIAAPFMIATSSTATSTFAGGIFMKNATTTNLEIGGTCTNCLSGYEQITNTQTGPTVSLNGVTQTATCSTGKHVISGGGADSGGPTLVLYVSQPASASSWTAGFVCQNGGSTCGANTVTVYAICAYP